MLFRSRASGTLPGSVATARGFADQAAACLAPLEGGVAASLGQLPHKVIDDLPC